jgi:HSP20 family protein
MAGIGGIPWHSVSSIPTCNPNKGVKYFMNIVRYQRYPSLVSTLDRFATIDEAMDRAFESSFSSFFRPLSVSPRTPALDVYQDKDQFTVVVELPGLKKEDIQITFENGVLAISGESKVESSNESFQQSSVNRFQRSVTLPIAVESDKAKATYENGLLQVVLPKAEEAKPNQITLD